MPHTHSITLKSSAKSRDQAIQLTALQEKQVTFRHSNTQCLITMASFKVNHVMGIKAGILTTNTILK